MSQDRWRSVEELFHRALEQKPESRAAFLDAACSGDAELRQQVEALLSRDEKAGSFLEGSATSGSTVTLGGFSPGTNYGPYQIVAPLGAGGMGEVYRAHDSKLGRDVAIKTLPAAFARDPERLARFRREARTLASLNHPNIAAIYGLEESGGVDCLVLELVEGETLRGPLPIEQALDCARQVAEALEAAHANGIIHRDLKPANVKVTPQGRVKVLDFGLAKAIWGAEEPQGRPQPAAVTGIETQMGRVMGTPGYMSPEQARGEAADKRSDIWAFGCLLFELLAGKRTFAGDSVADTLAAVLEREPDWQALPAKTPAKIRDLLRQSLQKESAKRLGDIAEARKVIESFQRRPNRLLAPAMAAAVIVLAAIAAAVWVRTPARVADRSQWEQLTNFPDSVTQPALSPDGKMLTFLRGDYTFFGTGEIYVKILPDGEPVQLTHDKTTKMSPVFSPDGTRIAYTVTNAAFDWDTWTVPVLGGNPALWLKNASGLIWTAPHQLMFSEIKMGVHMGLVTSADNRMGAHDLYLPGPEPNMAHRSYLSPDGKWVLLVEMDEDHLWEPCRVVPADGSSQGRKVGPPKGGCTVGAWSRDSKWIYLTSNAVAANHIWRQRFPDGKPELVTPGPTEEEGIAMAPDGRSLITSVALRNSTLWVHDDKGERRISIEGNAANPKFTPDGKKLCFRKVTVPFSEAAFYRDAGEVYVNDLESGRSETLVPGMQALSYDLSPDGREVAIGMEDAQGKQRIWIAPLDRSAPPRQIPGIEGGSPMFGTNGDVLFRHVEGSHLAGTTGYIYRVHRDGTGMQKASPHPILIVREISADRRWLSAWGPIGDNGPPAGQLFPLEEESPARVMGPAAFASWSPDGAWVVIFSPPDAPIADGRSYLVPLERGQPIPRVPAGGFRTEEDVARLPGARRIDERFVAPGPLPGQYAFYRGTTIRNLYRIPIN